MSRDSELDQRKQEGRPLTVDKDVFGDGSVIVSGCRVTRRGHSSLLVRLKETGRVLLPARGPLPREL